MKHFLTIVIVFIQMLFPLTAYGASIDTTFFSLAKKAKLNPDHQAVCIETLDQVAVLSHNATARIIPASVSKLYVFDWALTTLPIDFRYTTTFYLSGKTLYINGGGDPHFVVEHMRNMLTKIYDEKKVVIDTVVFSPNFYFNWKSLSHDVQIALSEALKASTGLPVAKNVTVIPGKKTYTGKGIRYEFQSAPLPALLKQINDYSTNISADTLFVRLGGAEGFSRYMERTYGAKKDKVAFNTGSGLYGNYTTCDVTMQLLRHLHTQIEKHGLQLTDILSMPRIDPGVLNSRLIDKTYAQSLVAKSGFVNYHHSLAGVISTKKGPLYFAVFTDFDDMKKSAPTKTMIDYFMNEVLKQYQKNLKSFRYVPDVTILKDVRITRG